MFSKEQRTSIVGTLIFHGIILAVLLLCGFTIRLPLPDEPGGMALDYIDGGEGMGNTNYGDSDDGMGNTNPELPSANPTPSQPRTFTASNDNVYSQNTDNTDVTANTQNTSSNPSQQASAETPEAKPVVNQAALFPGKGRTANGGNEGTTGKPGNQGNPYGSLDGTSYTGTGTGNGSGMGSGTGTGTGNGNGGGISFDLARRKANELPKPTYTSDEVGDVVVKIWVDQTGKVIKAQAGEKGTTAGTGLWPIAAQAAYRAKFSSDPDAAEVQTGTITYKFRKN